MVIAGRRRVAWEKPPPRALAAKGLDFGGHRHHHRHAAASEHGACPPLASSLATGAGRRFDAVGFLA